jgi:hypothetical protein
LLLLTAAALFVATASAPSGWKWDKQARADDGSTPSGWSWNEAEVVATGDGVTLAGETSTVTVAAPETADPTVGDSVVTVTTDDNTLLGFRNGAGEISWVPLGWSWNE